MFGKYVKSARGCIYPERVTPVSPECPEQGTGNYRSYCSASPVIADSMTWRVSCGANNSMKA